MMRHAQFAFGPLAIVLLLVTESLAAPSIQNVSLRGLQIGHPTTLIIDGGQLIEGSQVAVDVPLASQVVHQATGKRLEVEVTVDASAHPGIYSLRVVNAKGVSNAVTIGIDALAQQPIGDVIEQRPVALHGSVTGGQTLKTKFAGKQGERVLIDVESRRLGAQLRPVVRLYDPHGAQIAWSTRRHEIGDDARVETILPHDGEYAIELHDVVFRGASPGFFRMKVGDLQVADFALPSGVKQGEQASLELRSTAHASAASVSFDASAAIPGDSAAPLPTGQPAFTGDQPRLIVSDFPELTEGPAGESPQVLPQIPIAVSGMLATANEEDRYQLPVTPGTKLRFELFADRLGASLDGVLAIRNLQGNQIARGDDQKDTTDPMVEYTVPKNVDHLVVAISDLVHRGGDAFRYRLVVQPAGQPDFRLSVDPDHVNVPAGSTQIMRVDAQRMGYNGPIELSFDRLPDQVEVAGNLLPAGQNVALVSLTSTGTSPTFGIGKLIGRAMNPQVNIARLAQAAEQAYTKHQPWRRSDLAVAITEPAPVAIAWADATEQTRLPLGQKLPVKVRLNRAAGTEGKVRLRLLTTQITPKKTIKKDNKDVEVDDVERTLRLQAEPVVASDVSETTVDVLVPADLGQIEWGLAIVAELLSADEKNVVASTTTPVLRLQPSVPFTIELTGADRVEAKAGAGDTGQLTGKISRVAGFEHPVTISLTGLPKEYPAPNVTVPADASEFALPVRFPYGAPAGDLASAKLVGTWTPDAERPSLQVTSREIPIASIKVMAGEKPAAQMPLVIFEDDPKFVSYLSQGSGQISLDEVEKYSGAVAVKVTPDQRFHESLPTLGVKIRENPGPGEYRYLRFAWKKKGGASVCLQLNHDGVWGPSDGTKPGAKFRYHAGPGGECYGASLVVNDQLPAEFEVVTRDLFADFGEFTLSGLALSPVDGEYALFDHLLLGTTPADFELAKP